MALVNKNEGLKEEYSMEQDLVHVILSPDPPPSDLTAYTGNPCTFKQQHMAWLPVDLAKASGRFLWHTDRNSCCSQLVSALLSMPGHRRGLVELKDWQHRQRMTKGAFTPADLDWIWTGFGLNLDKI